MNTKHPILVFFMLLLMPIALHAQIIMGFSHEIGVITGPVAFQSDFGLRNDFDTNRNNLGWGVGLIHYFNFSYRADCNCYTRDRYFNDHFKLRSELDFHFTKLTHEGPLAEKDTDQGRDLRDHKGTSAVFEAGIQLEYYPLSIRDFAAGGYLFAPYISAGIHYVYYSPGFSSIQDVPGATPEEIYFDDFLLGEGRLGGIDDEPGSTYAITGSIGTRYKLTKLSDLNLEIRYHHYHSNWVDGLNPDPELYPPNKYDDSIVWLSLGYIYYIN